MKKIIFCAVILFSYSSVMGIERTFQGNDYQFGTTSSLISSLTSAEEQGRRSGRRTLGITDDATGEENIPGEWNQPQHGSDPLHNTPIGDGIVSLLFLAIIYAVGLFIHSLVDNVEKIKKSANLFVDMKKKLYLCSQK